MVFWKDVDVAIRHKCWHVHKIGGRLHRDFTNDIGDVPVAHYNEITKCWEDVVNHRGIAYGARKRQMYRARPQEILI